MMMMTMFVDIIVAGVIMMVMVATVVDIIVAGIMMMVMVAIVLDIFVTGVIWTMRRRRRMVRRMVRRRMVRRRSVIAVDLIATSDHFSRRSHRKAGKNESNENFELHISLEY